MLVLLVHGLGRTPLSLFGLAAALRRAGHHTRFFGYSPTFEPLPRIVNRLTNQLQALARIRKSVGLVGHSLGGLLLRMALDRVPELSVHRLVMLGSPNRGSLMARLASRWLPFRLLAGSCGRFLADSDLIASLPRPRVPFTAIAGTGGPCGRFSPFGQDVNDGLVSVAEAAIEAESLLQFRAIHSFLMDSPAIRACVLDAFSP